MNYRLMLLPAMLGVMLWCLGISNLSVAVEEPDTQQPQDFVGASGSTPVATTDPPVVAEGSNSCEIVSCGMGIKESCKITCPADKTPKCSCDCARNIGPMCMDYKANCRCE